MGFKSTFKGLISQQGLLSAVELVCFLSSHDAPVKQLTSNIHVAAA